MSLQSDTSGDYISTTTLQFHEEEVVKDAIEKTGFQPVKLLNKSHWWGSKDSGAFHYAGEFEGKKAILKIQGAKSSLSEAEMIASFAKVNKSQTIRPPHLYAHLPWSESLEYEALILEWIKDDKVIECPAFVTEVVLFYSLYEDYRLHCVTEPWVVKPQGDAASYIQEKFALWRQEGKKMYPEHPLRRDEDEKLIEQAVEILTREYAGVPLEFQHGHFSAKDLFWVNDQVVLLSNLYWSWRAPFYDGVFGYHWFMYDLAEVDGVNEEVYEEQRQQWLDALTWEAKSSDKKQLLRLALLERTAAGLNLDALLIDQQKPLAAYAVSKTRENLQLLLEELQ